MSMARRVYRYLWVWVMALLVTTCLWADVTGSIHGYVRDNSGAVIPNASVTATEIQTNYSRTVKSDASGAFSLLALSPGVYRLSASAAGFEQAIIDHITLNVNDALNFDFALQIGNVSQSVTVNAAALQVETTATSTGTTISSNQILAMPLNGRSYLDLLSLQPGVAPGNTNSSYNDRLPASGLYGSAGNQSTDGQPEWANAFLVNGAEVNETQNNGAGMIPDADSVAEFRLLTNSYSAEYGKFTGAVMNTVTKSGTNTIHGTLFEFYRNQDLDAINYFDSTKAELKRHQFGGVIGGPIWKNRLFTFSDYQMTRQVAGVSTGVVQVLSNDERNGIFSDAILDTPVEGSAWAATLQARNPGGGAIVGAGPGCTGACTPTMYNQLGTATATTDINGNIVPARNISAYIDPVAALTMSTIPAANQANGYDYDNSAAVGSIIDTNWAERIDFDNVKTGDWMFYYHYDGANAVNPVYSDGEPTLPGSPISNPSRSQLFVMSNTKTIGATTVNVARAQFFRWQEHTANPDPATAISSYSVYGFNTNPATGGLVNSAPSGYQSNLPTLLFNTFTVGTQALNLYQPETNFGFEDTVSKVLGNHSMSFGGSFRKYYLNARNIADPNGQFSFNGTETAADVSDYFIGAPAQFIQSSIQLLDNRTWYIGAFAQDSWKATPNLTLNYGLRWDVPRPWSDAHGRLTTPEPGVQSVKFPDAPLGLVVPGDPGVPSTISPTRWNNFGPRVGIAWAPSGGILGAAGTTSIRAAYGIYYLGSADNGNFGVIGDAPWGLYWNSPQPTEFGSPYITRATGASQGQKFPFTFPSGPGPFPNFLFGNLMPLDLPGYWNHNKVQTAQHWNLSLQRQLGRSTVATVAYVGTVGRHIQNKVNLLIGSGPLCLSIPGCGPNGESGVYTVGGTTYYSTLLGALDNQTISPNYTNSTGEPVVAYNDASYDQNQGNSNYNALQASVERRASDLTFLLAYTYAKSLDDVGALYDPRMPSRSYGKSSWDIRQNFVASYSWAIPFQRFLGHNRASEGWSITGISHFNTGFPFSTQSSGDKALSNRDFDYPNQIAPFKRLNARAAGRAWFDKTAFASNLSCGYETCGVTGDVKQFAFSGPGTIETDAGVQKDTRITERMRFNLRIEMFNVFNHANFNTVSGNANSGLFGQATNTQPARIGQISGKFIF
jgi:hypothetical protein